MEKQVEILAVGTNVAIMETVARLINKNPDWKGTCAFDTEEALSHVRSAKFDLILIGAGLSDNVEKDLEYQIRSIDHQVKVVRHYGGGSGLLFSEISAALASKD